MSEPSKRFIKKVPPSGAAPVFKLTLPHQIVHTHLSHLIDHEFEIATSPHSTNCWQGTITPRRNKNRSEYTLQGWRLFAEAHGVQSGDQVSFELVSPKRLVVRVMSTEEANLVSPGLSNATSAFQDDPHSVDSPPQHETGVEALDIMGPLEGHLEHTAERRIDVMQEGPPFRPARSMESCFQSEESEDMPKMQRIREFLSTGPAAARPPSFAHSGPSSIPIPHAHGAEGMKNSIESPSESVQNLHRDWGFNAPQPVVRSFPGTPISRQMEIPGISTPSISPTGALTPRREVAASPYPTGVQVQNQMLEMRSTIQAQQASLHFYETKARRAEYEASQIRLFYSELHVSMSKQTRLVIQAGEALERLISRISGPELLAHADQATSERLVLLQTELFKQLHNLKSCLLNLLSLEV